VSLVEQELPTLPEHLSSPPVFSGVRVIRSLVLYVCFVDRCLSSCTFSFGHCVVYSSSIYGFWLLLWYLQILQAQIWQSTHVVNHIWSWCVNRILVLEGSWGRLACDRMVVGITTTYGNQCLSLLKLWVRIQLMARYTRYNTMW
jgi:hypothetical protein